MSNDPTRPDVGDLIVDARNLASDVVDLPPGGRLGLMVAHAGSEQAIAEIRGNQATLGLQAGIRDEDIAEIDRAMAQIDHADALLPAAYKMVELIEETRASLVDGVQRRVFTIAQIVESRAKLMRNDELLARYAKTREYRSAIGYKAARTRLRNQAAAEAEATGEAEDSAETAPNAAS